jgi:hypothetical protein
MFNRIRIDILDAITAFKMREYRMMLPGWLYAKTFYFANRRIVHADIAEQMDEDTCTAHGVFCCDRCFDMSVVASVDIDHKD